MTYPKLFSLTLVAIGLMSSCATSPNYDFAQRKFVRETDCSGRHSNWEICYKNATDYCKGKGYKVIYKDNYYHDILPSQTGLVSALSKIVMDEAFIGKDNHRKLKFECKNSN